MIPDIVCLRKGVGGGLPLEVWWRRRPLSEKYFKERLFETSKKYDAVQAMRRIGLILLMAIKSMANKESAAERAAKG